MPSKPQVPEFVERLLRKHDYSCHCIRAPEMPGHWEGCQYRRALRFLRAVLRECDLAHFNGPFSTIDDRRRAAAGSALLRWAEADKGDET